MTEHPPPLPPRVRLIGRDAEVAAVLSALQAGVQGQPTVVLITGEPGVGKTRLMTEVGSRAAATLDARVLAGYALESGGMPPYFPLSRALRGAVDQLVRSAPALGQPASVLAMAGIAGSDFSTFRPPASLAPDAERLRLNDAVAEVCLHLASTRPLLLTLDDLQWADAGTWEIVAYSARAATGAPIGIVIACRDEALMPGSPGAQALVELNRHRLLLHLPLLRLSPDDVRLLGQEYLGGLLTDDLAALLADRSEGNPFFAEEVLRGLHGRLVRDWSGAYYLPARERAAAVSTSPTLRLTIAGRLGSLPPETQAALRAGAVLGRSFSSRLLARMGGQDVDDVEHHLGPALAADVLTVTRGEYAFRHDIIRETAYDLAAGERRRLHEAAARALEEEGVSTFEALAALAHHWHAADAGLVAARAAAAAARAATEARAYPEALRQATTARELYERAFGAHAEADELQQARIAFAEAALTIGDYVEAEAAYRQVLAHAERRRSRTRQGRVWSRLGMLFRRRERTEEAAACFTNALAILREADDAQHDLAETLVELAGLEGLTRARYDQAEAFGAQAMAIANALGDARLQASAALALAGVRVRAVDPTAGRPLLRQALDLALAAAEPLLAAEACAGLSTSYYWTGAIQEAHAFARQRLELAERAGDVFGMRHAHSWLAIVLLTLGEWEQARALLDHCEPLLARLDNPEPVAFARILRAVIAYQLGDTDTAYTLASEVVQHFERVDPATAVWYRGILVLACLATGRADEAERSMRLLETRLDTLPESALPARSARTTLGLAYVALGDRARAAACERALRPYAGDHHWWLTRRTLAELAALRGDRTLALADLAAAEVQACQEGLRPDLALIRLRRAELLGPSSAVGRALLSDARQLLAALSMRAPLARADGWLASATPRSAAGLTPREVEVLRHLAQGMTNREIAEVLVISENTVVNHLSHIFAKIGVDNRTGAAAFALREGLV